MSESEESHVNWMSGGMSARKEGQVESEHLLLHKRKMLAGVAWSSDLNQDTHKKKKKNIKEEVEPSFPAEEIDL